MQLIFVNQSQVKGYWTCELLSMGNFFQILWGYISVIIMEGVVILWEGYPSYLGVVILRQKFLLAVVYISLGVQKFIWGVVHCTFWWGSYLQQGYTFHIGIIVKDVLQLVLLFWEGCSFHFGEGVFYCWRGGPFLGVPGVSASHTPTCTESKGHVISYCPVTRSKVNDTVLY